ncbi:tRNA (guanosine(46)-N7)-methyltransferase TrmB [cyanobacterium endosymbiont of Epithemia clementina EcSB]|uniref:tRNA (guanosine(46)-N7)-methyltransferase TrmB n=1 Tax=cyanobacterium endosymbiont of Epithemia clementina EcSB TaxID=3034674 RepID=UPI00248136BD|nr:tRNA (guanosine(46)-N7)-methyltransferase TrmB [cyanobacterium endosymbiont of Epithemia clementina EcSB]WGT66994.1 tRNA (guanosine(46)-N7)-methyltransferase TrmB [cyanobacterium endosymbiont of Epithemia clementina EcSB]
MGRVRVRQHVNPLSGKYRQPITLPHWEDIYGNYAQPLHLDIGCARGKFLFKMASLYPKTNFLGIEIREPLVTEANEHRDRLGLTNLHFLFCNINLFLNPLLASLRPDVLQWVTIQFPDPWFKHRHLKRRVVQAELVDTLAQYLADGGTVFLQSDIKIVAQEMGERFLAHPNFVKQHSENWLPKNPFDIATEREIASLNKGKYIYRLLLKNLNKLVSLY